MKNKAKEFDLLSCTCSSLCLHSCQFSSRESFCTGFGNESSCWALQMAWEDFWGIFLKARFLSYETIKEYIIFSLPNPEIIIFWKLRKQQYFYTSKYYSKVAICMFCNLCRILISPAFKIMLVDFQMKWLVSENGLYFIIPYHSNDCVLLKGRSL